MMRTISVLALLLVASAAVAQAKQLNDDMLLSLQPLTTDDIVPRLLRELGIGDYHTPGAYVHSASTTPGAYGSPASNPNPSKLPTGRKLLSPVQATLVQQPDLV